MYSVLIVDDEQRCIRAIRENILWNKLSVGQVLEAGSSQSAKKVLTEHSVDILICDIEMPGESGLELVSWMQVQGMEIPTIFETCHAEFPFMRQAIRLQCFDYILKPIDYDELARILFDLVQKIEAGETQVAVASKPSSMDVMVNNYFEASRNRDIEKGVKQYVRDHLRGHIAIEDIADALHFSPQHLMRIFKSKTGMSVLDYITTTRVETAKKILKETNIPVKLIADMVGYEDYAYFTRVFKKRPVFPQSNTDKGRVEPATTREVEK